MIIEKDSSNPMVQGNAVLIRTISYHYIGRIAEIVRDTNGNMVGMMLTEASWLADTGRFNRLLKTGQFDDNAEIEPYSEPVFVPFHTIADVTLWKFELPKEEK